MLESHEHQQRSDAGDPNRLFNRELSWLQFNRRVLGEALNPRHPLLERVKFLAIFSSNWTSFSWCVFRASTTRLMPA